MTLDKRTLILDVGVINQLADDPAFSAVISKVKRRFTVDLTSVNLEEIAATPKMRRRLELIDVCRRLLPSGDCIQTFSDVIVSHVRHFETSASYNWRNVPVLFPEGKREIRRPHWLLSDDLAEQQHRELKALNAEFLGVFKSARDHFQGLFDSGAAQAPIDLIELVRHLKINPGAFWAFGADFYSRATGHAVDENTVRRLVTECPPFHALILAMCMVEFQECIRDFKMPSMAVGRIDVCSAVYLPYCDIFVSAEKRGRQAKALREIARVGDFDVEIVSYDEFRERLMLPDGFTPPTYRGQDMRAS